MDANTEMRYARLRIPRQRGMAVHERDGFVDILFTEYPDEPEMADRNVRNMEALLHMTEGLVAELKSLLTEYKAHDWDGGEDI